jgi:HAD superfamily hydrolase (TIGR01549 family)
MACPYPGTGGAMTEPAPSGPATPAAVLLDVDGTLVDTVYQHVYAWWEAFGRAGHAVDGVAIHRTIGRGSHDLVQTLLGRPDEEVVEGHAKTWGELRDRCRTFPRVPELLRHCAGRGLRVVLATSASADDLAFFRRVLGAEEAIHGVVSAADVQQAKPSPEIVETALRLAGVPAGRAVMVGDTVYDVRAAVAAGVPCIALLCGGIGRDELVAAGAAAVYDDPAALLADVEGSPLGRLLS